MRLKDNCFVCLRCKVNQKAQQIVFLKSEIKDHDKEHRRKRESRRKENLKMFPEVEKITKKLLRGSV